MPKIRYIARKFSPKSEALIDSANKIIREYSAQGFDLTLRQLYYQFVARDLIPNTLRSYKNLGSVVNDARLAGLVDWNSIVDRTRNLVKNSHWDSPAEIVRATADQYQIDKWATQPYRLEVWIEKDALVGVIENVCSNNDVAFFSCRGYTSQSELWAGAQRLRLFGARTEVRRIALNMDQVLKYDPPPNPAKLSDSRADAYVAEFGDSSWELDALEPQVLTKLIQVNIDEFRKPGKWKESVAKEDKHKERLERAADEIEMEEENE